MAGISGVLSIASRALWASQMGVEVTSHNIANMNTEGYIRQNLVLAPEVPIQSAGLFLGTGVQVSDISSVQDRYLNYQMFVATSLLGFRNSESDGLTTLQEIFNESDEVGLSVDLGDFFASWQDLSANPENEAPRVGVVGAARVVVNQFHLMNERLRDVQNSANNAVKDYVTQINNLARQIAELNDKVAAIEVSGQSAGDFRATRTQRMKELAELVDFHTFEDSRGQATIILAGGSPLVESNAVGSLELTGNVDGFYDVQFVSAGGQANDITAGISGGKLGGALVTRDTHARNLIDRLDEMAYELVNAVNTQHAVGFGLNGSTGLDFFAPLASSADASRMIEVDALITADSNNIAASASGAPGDNQNAIAVSAIENALIFNGGTWTFQDTFSSIVGEIGVDAQAAIRDVSHQQTMTNQLVNLRESVVGVSLEDEMSNLMKYQFSYQAASRLFTVVDEMLQTLSELR
ncbi:MAG: flagellar hook-associated protein FlgK [Deltaproteobacteria bacterium]|nr:flagellar hook-associated protein FlgK [Deltaproteobacteria bacterium]